MILRTLLVLLALLILSQVTNCFRRQPTRNYGPVPLPKYGGIGYTFQALVSALAIHLFSRLRMKTKSMKTTTMRTTTTTMANGCPSEYLLFSENGEEFCYRFETINCSTFEEAERECIDEGSNLYAPSSSSYSFFQRMAASQQGDCLTFWIGARTTTAGVPFLTVLGATIQNDSPLWAGGEPTGFNGRGQEELCAAMSRNQNYLLNDDVCEFPHAFICQRFIPP